MFKNKKKESLLPTVKLEPELSRGEWMQKYWRPCAAFMYMICCLSDFAIFPIMFTVVQFWEEQASNDAFRQWVPITLQGGGINSSVTTITLSSIPAGLPSAGFIKIDSETISYAGVNPAANQLINCARGQNGTTAASHTAGAAVTQQNIPCFNLWPTPNAPGDQYTLVYWYLRRIQDAGTGVTEQDIPFRWLNCMIAGLAYHLSVKLEGVTQERVMFLKADYEDQFGLASTEDRETAPVRFVPRNLFYYN